MHLQKLKEIAIRILRKSERYAKIDMLYLAKGSLWLGLLQFVSSVCALALTTAFANLLPKEAYGTYKYTLSIAGMFSLFSLPGIQTAITRATAKDKEHVLPAATRARILHALAGSTFALIIAGVNIYQEKMDAAFAFLLIAVTLPFFDTFTNNFAYLLGKHRFDLYAKHRIRIQIISTAFVIAALLYTDKFWVILLAYFLPLIGMRFFLYRRTLKEIRTDVRSLDDERTTIVSGRHLTAMNILDTLAINMDKVILWQFLGPAQIASYTIATAVPEQLKGVFKNIGDVAFPKFASKSSEDVRHMLLTFWPKIILYTGFLLILALAYMLLAPYIFQILFPQYLHSIRYTQIAALGLATAPGALLMNLLVAQNKIKMQYYIQTIQSVTRIVLFIILIPLFGIIGALIATLTTRIVFIFMTVYAIHRSFHAEQLNNPSPFTKPSAPVL